LVFAVGGDIVGVTTVMEGGLNPISAWLGRALVVLAVAGAALMLAASLGPADASAKGKKVRACVVKKGPDKGVMRFSPKGKCHKGEKKISWGKKGKRGPAGPAGPAGAQGSSGVTEELLATIAAQQATIDQLTSRLDALAPQVAALCSQMPTVVSQVNTLGTVISGIGLPVGVISFVTPVPAALGAFACP
jgi:hypothetical protein